jgi:hypothetical protein
LPLGLRGNGAKLRPMTATARVTWAVQVRIRATFGPPVGGVVVLLRAEGKRKGHG